MDGWWPSCSQDPRPQIGFTAFSQNLGGCPSCFATPKFPRAMRIQILWPVSSSHKTSWKQWSWAGCYRNHTHGDDHYVLAWTPCLPLGQLLQLALYYHTTDVHLDPFPGGPWTLSAVSPRCDTLIPPIPRTLPRSWRTRVLHQQRANHDWSCSRGSPRKWKETRKRGHPGSIHPGSQQFI